MPINTLNLNLAAVLGGDKKDHDKYDGKYGQKDDHGKDDHKKDDHGKDNQKDDHGKYGQKDDHGKDDHKKDDHGKDNQKDDHGKYGQKDDDKKDDYKDSDGKNYGEREDHDSYADHNKKHYDDYLVGTKDDDKLYGGNGDDYLDGRKGNDELYGERGNDTLYGGKGDDWLVGGKGDDKIDGGKGEDDIVFSGVTEKSNGFDKIFNFESGEDTLKFSLKDIKEATGDHDVDKGPLGRDHFKTTDGDDHDHHGTDYKDHGDNDFTFIYNDETGVLSFDADGKGGDDGVDLVSLVGSPDLHAADIVIADIFIG
jgi:Ca2+-binding RTX toxin-like protein